MHSLTCSGAKSFALQRAKYSDLCLCWFESNFIPFIFPHPPPLPGPITPTQADTEVASRSLRSRRGSRRNPKNGALSRRILCRYRGDLPTAFPRLINATLPPRNRRSIKASSDSLSYQERSGIGTLGRTPQRDSFPFSIQNYAELGSFVGNRSIIRLFTETCGVSPSSVTYGDSFPPGGSLSALSLPLEGKVPRRGG